MKKITALFAAMVLMGIVSARTINTEEAAKVCRNFLAYKMANGQVSSTDFNYKSTEYLDNEAVYHIFNVGEQGFLVVSASDMFEPIVCYSFESNYAINPAFEFAMNAYAHWISYCEKNGELFREDVPAKWQKWLAADFTPEPTRAALVGPLVTTKWNQDGFFNVYCPYDHSYHIPCYTGCVATAMSQILNYYGHPITGKGGTDYTHPTYGSLSVRLRQHTYNYNAMPNVPNTYCNEMAKLLSHCGIVVQMGYTPTGSGAHSVTAAEAMSYNFKYNNAIIYQRAICTLDSIGEWLHVLKMELDQYHPLYYSANDGQGGHAFIVDGYDDLDKFHVNWGWGGASDGFFTISDNDPSCMLGYIYGVEIIRNCYPVQDAPEACAGRTRIDAASGHFQSNLPNRTYSANSDCSWMLAAPEASRYVLHFDRLNTEENADIVTVYNGPTVESGIAAQVSGTAIPSDITVNADSVLITFTSNGSDERQGFRISFTATTAPQYCAASTTITGTETITITDGSGDANYRNNTKCTWDIQVPNMGLCYFSFPHFDLGSGDFIEFYNTAASTPDLIARYDWNNYPEDVVTLRYARIRMRFVADNWDVNQGFEMTCQPVTAINDNAGIDGLRIFPNPANDQINVHFSTQNADNITCQLVDMNGRSIYSRSFAHSGGAFSQKISVSDCAKGIYFLRIQTSEGSSIEKIVVN